MNNYYKKKKKEFGKSTLKLTFAEEKNEHLAEIKNLLHSILFFFYSLKTSINAEKIYIYAKRRAYSEDT